MVIGCLPVGGRALRLGMLFPKELLPLKGFDHYRPLISHVVDKMVEAGAEKLIFVHGEDYKEEIRRLYPQSQHIKQGKPGFARVLEDCWVSGVKDEDQILFGLPDSLFEGNPFPEMLKRPKIVAGLFITAPETKVDRLVGESIFDIKASKNEMNRDLFWGVLKFDGADLRRIVESGILDKTNEIGNVLNENEFTCVTGGRYQDLGTWSALNQWWGGPKP